MEAKHSYFKKISQIGNYINVPYSVAVRHQRLLCASLQGNFFDYDNLQSGPCTCINQKFDADTYVFDVIKSVNLLV